MFVLTWCMYATRSSSILVLNFPRICSIWRNVLLNGKETILVLHLRPFTASPLTTFGVQEIIAFFSHLNFLNIYYCWPYYKICFEFKKKPKLKYNRVLVYPQPNLVIPWVNFYSTTQVHLSKHKVNVLLYLSQYHLFHTRNSLGRGSNNRG